MNFLTYGWLGMEDFPISMSTFMKKIMTSMNYFEEGQKTGRQKNQERDCISETFQTLTGSIQPAEVPCILAVYFMDLNVTIVLKGKDQRCIYSGCTLR